MGKRKLYLTLDCETATLPFADIIARGDSERKKRIAISKPLIYDIAWRVHDRDNNEYSRHSFLISEIFSVPQVFNTAYYKEKRPKYLQRLRDKEITLTDWNTAIDFLMQDLKTVEGAGAYNSMFDFKKAIPFTERYIRALYSNHYQEWEQRQYKACEIIADSKPKKSEQKFEPGFMELRDIEIPIFDIWNLACRYIIDNQNYKRFCFNNGMLTNSLQYFKTSAEQVFRYIARDKNFIEAHTAFEDVTIESEILCKILKKHSVEYGIEYFPFKQLETTVDFLRSNVKMNFTLRQRLNFEKEIDRRLCEITKFRQAMQTREENFLGALSEEIEKRTKDKR